MSFSHKTRTIHYQANASYASVTQGYCNPTLALAYGVSTENWRDVNCKKCLKKKKESQKREGRIIGGQL